MGVYIRGGISLTNTGVRMDECERLITLICQRQWEQIPTLLWHSRLSAQLEFERLRSTKKSIQTTTDLTRLAVGLTDSDVVFCDRSMANLVQNTQFNGLADVFGGPRAPKLFNT